MTAPRVSLSAQEDGVRVVIERVGVAGLVRAGLRQSEAELVHARLQATRATLQAIQPHETAVRDTIRRERGKLVQPEENA